MKAILGNVIIREIKEEKENSYGLIVTSDTKNEKFKRGIVLSRGELCEGIEEGDTVVYDMHRSNKITYCGEPLVAAEYGAIVIVE
jgi:co-chaperonin GroES (HSP10)